MLIAVRMKSNIKISNIKNKTFVEGEISIELMADLMKLVPSVDTLGMSEEKVKEQKTTIDKIVTSDKDLISLISFSNINGMSKNMVSQKYAKEIDMIQKLSANEVKQSFLRIYATTYKAINNHQLESGKQNFYMRKAARFGKEMNDFRAMHFAYSFDQNLAFEKGYNDLRELVTNKKAKD